MSNLIVLLYALLVYGCGFLLLMVTFPPYGKDNGEANGINGLEVSDIEVLRS